MSSSVTCHLFREDGSRWIVTEYAREADGVTVCAVRELGGRSRDGEPPAPGEDRRTSLWRSPLADGDRLEWRGADGRVLSSSGA